ncbi:MAG TPA: NADH-quinone oxidoreductase subunit J [Candidatus Sulfotelmatobacter sp.]|nr:NADH-quinone oxidoreductase subunit J [Candidatus Sulfotelmatobacter sp.]
MIIEVLSAGLVITACLAIFLDEAVYSVVALAGTFLFTSLLYALNGAVYVAVFQFAVGAGTLAILFLSGEMLSEKPLKKTTSRNLITVTVVGVLLSLPAMFLSISTPSTETSSVSFGEALWSLRAGDIVLQGLVIMTVAIGIAIVLYEKRNDRI